MSGKNPNPPPASTQQLPVHSKKKTVEQLKAEIKELEAKNIEEEINCV